MMVDKWLKDTVGRWSKESTLSQQRTSNWRKQILGGDELFGTRIVKGASFVGK